MLPLIVTTQFILTLSLAYAVAALQVPYRDTQYLLGIALFLGFYLCPVFYSASSIPPAFRFAYRSNPWSTSLRRIATLISRDMFRRWCLADYFGMRHRRHGFSCIFFMRSSAWFIEEF